MKKTLSKIMLAMLSVVFAFGFYGCSEMGDTNLTNTAIGAGDDTVIEVTVITDSFFRPIKVHFDEIFGPKMGTTVKKGLTLADGEFVATSNWGQATNYYKYVGIGDKNFKAEVNNNVLSIAEIGGTITDLMEYVTTDEGAKFFYDNAVNGKIVYYTFPKADNTKPTVTIDGKEMIASALTNSYGTIRKRYSSYWKATDSSSGSNLGWQGNMDALENYLLAYGFKGLVENDGTVNVTPKKDGGKYTFIGDVQTGATLANGGSSYLKVANLAYQRIMNPEFNYSK